MDNKGEGRRAKVIEKGKQGCKKDEGMIEKNNK